LPARHQDRVYRALVRAGITSIAQLAALSRDQLADLALPATTIRAVRRAVARARAHGWVPERRDTRDRHVAAELAANRAWGHEELLDALHVAARLARDPSRAATFGWTERLRLLTGVAELRVLADLLPPAARDLLTKAEENRLTEAELATL